MGTTVFPRIVCARCINFTVCVMRGQFEGVLYSRVRFNSTDHAAKPRYARSIRGRAIFEGAV